MPPPKRSAPRRTTAAVAEDLTRARWVGGLSRASQEDLVATLDWLTVAGMEPDEEPLYRARDLLLHHIKRVCENYRENDQADKTTVVASASLERLLLRPPSDTQLAQVIRRDATRAAGHSISADAVRHREDRLIAEIAQQVSEDLTVRRIDVPRTVEEGIHRLAPIAADLRQELHDLLCVIYAHVPPADPHERRTVDKFFRQVIIDFGAVLLAGTQLAEIGRRSPNLSRREFAFANLADRMVERLFDEADDREYMLEFISREDSRTGEAVDRLRSTGRGEQLYERWVEWVSCCYPTCAFERSVDVNYMCSPHALLTLLYDFEDGYVAAGYSDLQIPDNFVMRHHHLRPSLNPG